MCALRLALCARAQAAPPQKLDMTISADRVSAELRIKFDRKPESKDELALMQQMKDGYGFSWKGYGDAAKWHGPKSAVAAFEDRTFLARIKLTCKNISFYNPNGDDTDMISFIDAVNAFDVDALDCDLSSLGKSKVMPDTPAKPAADSSNSKRPRS